MNGNERRSDVVDLLFVGMGLLLCALCLAVALSAVDLRLVATAAAVVIVITGVYLLVIVWGKVNR